MWKLYYVKDQYHQYKLKFLGWSDSFFEFTQIPSYLT